MFFYLSKLLWFLATPSNLLVTLVLVGLVLAALTRLRRSGLCLAIVSTLGIFIIGLSPLATWVMYPLETQFPRFEHDREPVDGIIILGGSLISDTTVLLGQADLNEAGERVLAAVELSRLYPEARILLSGGSGRLIEEAYSEAEATADVLVRLGVPRERMILEGRSRNTHENAVFSLAMAEPAPGERWLLVTSAWHMPRSIGVFRQAGFDVTAYPVDFRTVASRNLSVPFIAVSEGLRRFDVASREWVGLIVYYFTDRTDALLPSQQ
jgi:uncharacterized SAM-binding protein YcdF (DUF218 family)